MTVEEGDALENSLFEAHTFLASFLCNRMLLTQLPTVGHKICIEQICFTAPPVRNLHNLRKILRPSLLFLSKMLCCLQLSLALCMLKKFDVSSAKTSCETNFFNYERKCPTKIRTCTNRIAYFSSPASNHQAILCSANK